MENVHSVEISDAYRRASQHEMQHDNFIHATLKKYRRDLNPIRSGRFANRAARDGGLRGRLVGWLSPSGPQIFRGSGGYRRLGRTHDRPDGATNRGDNGHTSFPLPVPCPLVISPRGEAAAVKSPKLWPV